MVVDLLKVTPRDKRYYGVAVFSGVITGVISAFVKSGTEAILPPRTPDRIAPPVQMLNDFGIDWHKLVYSYSEQMVYWGGECNTYHFFNCGSHHLLHHCRDFPKSDHVSGERVRYSVCHYLSWYSTSCTGVISKSRTINAG